MRIKLTSGLLGAVALLVASQSNAATVSVTPPVTDVVVNNPFMLTVQGSDFAEGMTDGGMILTYNTAQLQLDSTVSSIGTSASSNGLADFFAYTSIDTAAGIITVGVNTAIGSVVGDLGVTFDMFTLDFTALSQPGTSDVTIGLGDIGPWIGGAGAILEADMVYNPATVNAVPVPAAVWLFGSGLIGLVGIARRRTSRSA